MESEYVQVTVVKHSAVVAMLRFDLRCRYGFDLMSLSIAKR
jgi:hypothetical protein